MGVCQRAAAPGRLSAALWLALICLIPAFAQQDHPKAEVFGGFSYLPGGSADFPRGDSYGVQASLCRNLNRWFGAAAELAVQHNRNSDLGPNWLGMRASTTTYQYLVGPRFTARSGRLNMFAHALAGGARGRSSLEGFSDSSFALAAGGGMDVRVSDRFAVRVLQVDYIGSFADVIEDNVRVAFGAVWLIGR